MKKIVKTREVSSFLFLIALFAVVGLINPSFLTSENIISCFNDSVVYIIISVGMAFAIFIGEIDVSVGANLGFTATVVASMLRDGQNWALAFATGILIGALIGLFNGWGVSVMGVPSLIFTLGTNGVMRGMMYVYTQGAWVENLPADFKQLYSAELFGHISVIFVVTVIMVIAVHILLKHTKRGRYFIAVGDNPAGAALVGIPATGTRVAAYVICGIFAAISGIVFASRIGFVTAMSGNGYEMKAVAACVLGGISLSGGVGSVIGASIGAVIMASISRLLVFMELGSTYDNTITGVMLITIVVADALMQRRNAEKNRRQRLAARTAAAGEGGNK
ncbi:MAG: ABC transporter permease [Lachnospiraceae bacterium]|uniref:ABC transporter permease n=1 Tax=Parablautia sp. Marseille-Q6255 TaxID=3039593 RepID=UPI0024BCFD7D|nr:ABC transporter permease [Parablautia sp. Marseille-Q6255]